MATLQPSAASWRTSSRPIPVPPPVTTAIRPANSFIRYLPWASRSRLSRRLQRIAAYIDEVDPNSARDGSLIDQKRRSEGGPMSKTTMCAAIALMMAAGMAMAEAQTVTANRPLPGQMRLSEMTGAAVYDNQDKNVGSIKDIILDPDGRVAAVVLN